MMSSSRRSRYSYSPSPYKRYGRSVSRSLSRSRSRSTDGSRSRSPSSDVDNPGNNLYVTGLSPRITKRDLEKHFASEGTVIDVHLVVDPWTRESRGFGFVTMSSVREADRCMKYLNCSVLEGRVITVEKAKRRRGRTPTPGRYMGLRTVRVRRLTPSYSPRRSPSYSPYHRRSRSARYSSDRSRSRSYSPYHSRRRSYSPYYYRRRSYSPYYYSRSRRRSNSPYYDSRRRSYSRSPYSRSPVGRREGSYLPYESRYYSPDDQYPRRRRYHSVSRSPTPHRERRSLRRSYSHYVSPSSGGSYSRSISPVPRRSSRRSYSRSLSPRARKSSRRSCSRSLSPVERKSSRSGGSHGGSTRPGRSRHSYSRSPCASPSSRSFSRSVSSKSASP